MLSSILNPALEHVHRYRVPDHGQTQCTLHSEDSIRIFDIQDVQHNG
jgi:hypothetical protein